MVRGIGDLKRFTIAATDGNLGSVSDLYFDDRSWAVRYLVVDAGPRLPGRRLLVPPVPVRSSDPTTLRLGVSMRQLESGSVSSAQPCGVLPESLARAGDRMLRRGVIKPDQPMHALFRRAPGPRARARRTVGGQLDHHLVTHLRIQLGPGINVMRHARIVGDDVVNVLAFLQGANDDFAGAL